jgi:hypothetical protein
LLKLFLTWRFFMVITPDRPVMEPVPVERRAEEEKAEETKSGREKTERVASEREKENRPPVKENEGEGRNVDVTA